VILVRISGYGQSGPHAKRPGFANVAEAFGGLRYTTGEPGRPPVRTGVSLGDTLAGLHAAYGTLAAVIERGRSGVGQVVDCALYESVFAVMESLLPEFDLLGHVREPAGAAVPGVVPSNTYACADGRRIVLGANNDALFGRLMRAIGRDDLAGDPRLRRDDGRSAHMSEIDGAIEAWTRQRGHDEALAQLEAAEVPCGPILSIADIATDPHYLARGMFVPMTLPDGTVVRMPKVVPELSRTPPASREVGPDLGAHNHEVYGGLLGMSASELDELRARGVI
jgi:crotonobetainyl-CoA:carnitine CoA-transferase CaiB-like acyl-CoA transferase